MVETYSDFRDVNGIRIPFKVSSNQGGRKYGDGVTTQIKLNQGLKIEEMRKRPSNHQVMLWDCARCRRLRLRARRRNRAGARQARRR